MRLNFYEFHESLSETCESTIMKFPQLQCFVQFSRSSLANFVKIETWTVTATYTIPWNICPVKNTTCTVTHLAFHDILRTNQYGITTRCITLCGWIKGQSRDTAKTYPWKLGYNWNASWESYAHNWWINLRCCYSNSKCNITVIHQALYTKCYLNIVCISNLYL